MKLNDFSIQLVKYWTSRRWQASRYRCFGSYNNRWR